MGTIANNDNLFGTARFIVNPTAGLGNYTTIQAAITAASAGDTIFIMPAVYTENLTLKNGVNLAGYNNFGGSGQRTQIVGKLIDNGGAVNCSITNLSLKTNSDYAISLTGSGTVVVAECRVDGSNNTLFSCTGTANINCYNSYLNLATTGIAIYTGSSGYRFQNCELANAGGSTTASSTSGSVTIMASSVGVPIATSSTAILNIYNSTIATSDTNTIAITTAGTGTATINNTFIDSGSASAISIGTGTTVSVGQIEVKSSNTNAITGAGTLTGGNIVFVGTSSLINTTTQTFGYSQLGKYKASGQPLVVAYQSANQTNKTGDGTAYTILFDTVTKDQNSNYNSGTGVFTAPVAGVYACFAQITITNLIVGHTGASGGFTGLATSGACNPFAMSASGTLTLTYSGVFSLAAGTTFSTPITVTGSTKTVQVTGGADKTYLNVWQIA